VSDDIRVGAHISTAGGFPRAATRTAELGLDCVQHFTRNPRGGAQRTLDEREVTAHRRRMEELQIGPLVMHTPYTVNLASHRAETVEFSRRVVAEDLQRCHLLGAPYLVIHPGACGKSRVEDGISRIVAGLDRAVDDAKDTVGAGVRVLLEFMSGQGSEIGSTIEEMAEILGRIECRDAVGFCLDTCHCFARGYEVHTEDGLEKFLRRFDQKLSLSRLKVVHVNDSEFGLGTRRDRHAPLGRGELGSAGLRNIVSNPVLRRLPLILEVPVEDQEDYADEAELLRCLSVEGK